MNKRVITKNIYVDALALVPEKKSGIGYTIEQTLQNLASEKVLDKSITIYLVVPLGKSKQLNSYLKDNIKTKTIPLPARVFSVLLKTNLLLPLDWFLGNGIYVFPNYRNWPLWHSRSLTYFYDLGFIKFPTMVQPKNQKYLSRYSKRWIDRSNKIVTITKQVKYEIEKSFNTPDSKVDVVNCGVDTKVFYKRGLNEIEKVKSKYELNLKKYLLFVGNIEPRKNLITLLEAYSKLPSKLKDEYGVVIVGGDGWLNDEFYSSMAEINKNNPKIIVPSHYVETEDLPAIYSGASFLVHPAFYEGFGIPPLEAMACETPVIVSDIPAVREVVNSYGIYFDPYNVQSLSKAIVTAIKETALVGKNIVEGKKRAAELSWENSARELNEIIKNEFKEGPQKSPLLSRVKFIYVFTDRCIRALLGDKNLEPYKPKDAKNTNELQINIYKDFLNEFPSIIQEIGLKLYLQTKHLVSLIIKSTPFVRGH